MVRTEQQKTKAWQDVDKARAKYVREYETRFRNALNAQIAPVIVAIERGKANPENYIVELPVLVVLQDLYERVGKDFARDSYDALKGRKTVKSGLLTKADEPESQWLRFVRRWIGKEGAEKVVQITDTTKKFVKKVLDIGAKDGLSIDQMAKLMTDEANDINKYRAEVIARTEIIGASNKSSLVGAQSTGLKLNKEWLSTRDGRTRDSHVGVDGQTVPLEGFFTVSGYKLEHPGDSDNGAPASEIVSCRCTQVYEPA